MSARRLLVLATALGLGATSAVAAVAATNSPDWVTTHTQAVSLHAPALGPAPATQRLHVSVALALRDRPAIDRLIADQATPGTAAYGHFLTPAQVTARFGPTAQAVQAVTGYLTRQGFTNVSVASDRLLVDADGTAAQVEKAFATQLAHYRLAGRTVTVNTAPAKVPAALGRSVVAVLGLSDVPMATPAPDLAAAAPDLDGFGPRAVAHAYDADRMGSGAATSIAIVTGGDVSSNIAHLRYAEKVEHFPQVPVTVVYGAPKAAVVTDNPLSGNVEWDLDMQISTMVAQQVKNLYVYDVATFTDSEVARAINLFVSQNKATALSASLGECDLLAFLDGAMITTDQALAQGALQGQSMFASTGDNGYACPEVASTGAPEGPPGVSWPAVGEYTTAVGGTTLLADAKGNVNQEIAWIAGGGGISPWEAAAPWTLPANPAGQTWQYTNQGGRGVPDVSAVADPNTGVQVYAGGKTPEIVGGTSVSSPLVMGLWARVQTAHHNRAGLASFDLYRLYDKTNPGTVVTTPVGIPIYTPATSPKAVPGLRDIVLGSNGLYPATPGYDFTTGVGVLDTAKLSRAL